MCEETLHPANDDSVAELQRWALLCFALSEIFSTSLHHVGESKVSNLDVEVCVK